VERFARAVHVGHATERRPQAASGQTPSLKWADGWILVRPIPLSIPPHLLGPHRPVQTETVHGETNVLGGELQSCGTDPVTGFYRDGCCTSGPDQAVHLVCAVVTAEFLRQQRSVGNDLITPASAFGFPGLQPGDRWCVVAQRWLQAHEAGVAPPVVLASTNARALQVIDLAVLQQYAVDVPEDLSSLE
jgi:uncharacterized protein